MSWRALREAILRPFGRSGARLPDPVFEWVQRRNLAEGSTESLELPPPLRRESGDGRVYAARLADGRLCVMLKTRIGYKENFEGVVRCSGPLSMDEVINDGDRPYLSLAGHGIFEELYLRKRTGEREFEVFFDLN